ncbi:ADI_G0052300.mRNA.1.CDS.1 [Saccharomyces cerevisiae]|nr:Msk1p [Saccharomyces cerevisiae YJM969]AJT12179.1 Msk1p [Saccharomyces cerevisiae YJM981]AJT12560.1 Msk1p [Saccharomyces cerevisiae YJM984]AJT12942.1 Msk1p [Saccharomyces cerevisiae YJM987]AJT13327.1 Msk1p [Saccharomyces cerevisiae YJM990]AJT16696.1 Msk1p [Saccharomyces cerevisiae YJM1242]AJT20796.1 Msk1p [Saccharomyces cerevisiae YJM1336]AJT31472.1 Msk1p [Saccharomyces cerevisiae YJM1477]CAI4836715.1 ADI_G0052300.mRNA.1.CDS.1 [Saccharomyces cerevisiae]
MNVLLKRRSLTFAPRWLWCKCRSSRCRPYSLAHAVDTSKMEATRRNGQIVKDLGRYYPSMSESALHDLCQDYKEVTIADFNERFLGNPATLHHEDNPNLLLSINGRIKSIRFSGQKIVFIDLYNGSSGLKNDTQLQLIVNYNKIGGSSEDKANFSEYMNFLKKGDYIKALGYPGFSQSRVKMLSLICNKLPIVLSVSQLPLPSRLNDETKIKSNRVVDYQLNGTQTLLVRARIIKLLRKFLDDRNFVEVETPILSSKSNGAMAKPFITSSKDFDHLELRIAPELWLKRLIISGLQKVYEIGKVFRNEGIDSTHNAEFSTLEFYETYMSMDDIVTRTEDLFKFLITNLQKFFQDTRLPVPKTFSELHLALSENNWKFRKVEFLPTLNKELGIDLMNSGLDINKPSELLKALPKDIAKKYFPSADNTGQLSSLQILNKLSDVFLEQRHCQSTLPTVIYHQPAILSPLAKTDPQNKQVTKRFEVFIKGKEYINAYEEENCPQLQLQKFLQQKQINELTGNKTETLSPVIDYQYVETMKYGMPPVGGFGLGIDRLCMLFCDKKRIEEVLPFGCVDDVNRQ